MRSLVVRCVLGRFWFKTVNVLSSARTGWMRSDGFRLSGDNFDWLKDTFEPVRGLRNPKIRKTKTARLREQPSR